MNPIFVYFRVRLAGSIPIYPLQRVFYPQNLACTPKNDEVLVCQEINYKTFPDVGKSKFVSII